jgi:predicted RNase H-like HicB family nuclease
MIPRNRERFPAQKAISTFDIPSVDGYARVMQRIQLTAVVEREGSGYVSLCPELDVASQGDTVEEATANLREAVEAFFECASAAEIDERLHTEVYVTRLEVARG